MFQGSLAGEPGRWFKMCWQFTQGGLTSPKQTNWNYYAWKHSSSLFFPPECLHCRVNKTCSQKSPQHLSYPSRVELLTHEKPAPEILGTELHYSYVARIVMSILYDGWWQRELPPQTKINTIREISKITPTVDAQTQKNSGQRVFWVLKYFTYHGCLVSKHKLYYYILAYYGKDEFNNLYFKTYLGWISTPRRNAKIKRVIKDLLFHCSILFSFFFNCLVYIDFWQAVIGLSICRSRLFDTAVRGLFLFFLTDTSV